MMPSLLKTFLSLILVVCISSTSAAAPLTARQADVWIRLTQGLSERGRTLRKTADFLPELKGFELRGRGVWHYATIEPNSRTVAFVDSTCDLMGKRRCVDAQLTFYMTAPAGELDAAFRIVRNEILPLSSLDKTVRADFDVRQALWLNYALGLPRGIAKTVESSASFLRLKSDAGSGAAAPVRAASENAVRSASVLSAQAAVFSGFSLPAPTDIRAKTKESGRVKKLFKSFVSAALTARTAWEIGEFVIAAGAAASKFLSPEVLSAAGPIAEAAMWAAVAGVFGYSFYQAWKNDESVVDWIKQALSRVT